MILSSYLIYSEQSEEERRKRCIAALIIRIIYHSASNFAISVQESFGEDIT